MRRLRLLLHVTAQTPFPALPFLPALSSQALPGAAPGTSAGHRELSPFAEKAGE